MPGCYSKSVAVACLMLGTPAVAQNFDVAGNWSCSVAMYPADGRQSFGFQAEVSVQANGSLVAHGGVYDLNVMNSDAPFQAGGDWSTYADSTGQFVRLRAHTQTHGILVFEGYTTTATTIYWMVPFDDFGGQSETQCTRTS